MNNIYLSACVHFSDFVYGPDYRRSDRICRMKIKTLKDKERELIQEVLVKTDWNLEKASRLLQIPLARVKRKIREYGIKKLDTI